MAGAEPLAMLLDDVPAGAAAGSAMDRPDAWRWFAVAVAVLIFSALSLACALASEGFLEADACTHYLYARFAFSEPHLLVNLWGRPLVTGLYALPAVFAGRLGVQITSLLLALLCAWCAYRIALRQHYRWPALALIFTLAQPLVFLHSFSEMTELPFAALIILAFWAYRAREFMVMAFLVGLSPLGRPEGFGFLLLAAVALVLHRRWYWLWLLVLPLVSWNHNGWEIFDRTVPWWQWLPSQWPWQGESVYRSGPLLYFVGILPVIASPLIFPAMVLGIWRSLRLDWLPQRFFRLDHRRRCQVLIAVIPLLILVAHSLLYWLGKMASSGEPRYLLVVAPFWGLLSALGWQWAFARFQWKGVLRWAGVAALLPALSNHFLYTVLPLKQTADWQRARELAAWYRSDRDLQRRYPRIMTAHPGLYYYLDRSFTDDRLSVKWLPENVATPRDGTMLVWDPVYGVFNADADKVIRLDAIEVAGWVPFTVPIPRFYTLDETDQIILNRLSAGPSLKLERGNVVDNAPPEKLWHVFLSSRDATGALTPHPAGAGAGASASPRSPSPRGSG